MKIDVLIVFNMLLTGFDAPRNSVLYIARSLKEHGLLQAIARVNRLEEGKDYGEIRKCGNFGGIDCEYG